MRIRLSQLRQIIREELSAVVPPGDDWEEIMARVKKYPGRGGERYEAGTGGDPSLGRGQLERDNPEAFAALEDMFGDTSSIKVWEEMGALHATAPGGRGAGSLLLWGADGQWHRAYDRRKRVRASVDG